MFEVIPERFLSESLTRCFVQLQQTSSWEGAKTAPPHSQAPTTLTLGAGDSHGVQGFCIAPLG